MQARRPLRVLVLLTVLAGSLAGATATASASTQQPVDTHSTPDPGVVLYNGTFYAFTTGSYGLWESTATEAAGPWTAPADVLNHSVQPGWVLNTAGIWAPDAVRLPTGGWVVYFSALLNPNDPSKTQPEETPVSGARCIGAATAPTSAGPFTMMSSPLVCLEGFGAADDMLHDPGQRVPGEGVIDPDPVFIDNSWDNNTNELFLVYKTQSGTGQATIRMIRLDISDGTSVVGVSSQLLAAIPTGSGGTYQFSDTIEAPSMLALSDGWFVMFVAHGNYQSCDYSTEWYKTQHPWSWTQTPAGTLLSQGQDGLCGPGTADIADSEVSGQYRLFFNAYTSGTPNTTRELYADTVTIGSDGYTPVLQPLAPAS
jgi:arabinan endo-1,5-alpha-L-arabinosidase